MFYLTLAHPWKQETYLVPLTFACYVSAVAANKMQKFIRTGCFPAPTHKEQILDFQLI